MEQQVSEQLQPELEVFETTPKENTDIGGSTIQAECEAVSGGNKEPSDCDAGSREKFEELIKGPYKDAFSAKVQGIINKRFKQIKTGQAKQSAEQLSKQQTENKKTIDSIKTTQEKSAGILDLSRQATEMISMGYSDFDLESELKNPKLEALLKGGADLLTAYRAVHFDELIDNSVRCGAEMAAKQMADNLRAKASRPHENGLDVQYGLYPKKGASGLTPKKRRELAEQALMGHKVGF